MRSFHWFLFQLPWLPEKLVRAHDFAFVEFLWRLWSTLNYDDRAHMTTIKQMLAQPGAVEAGLAYYRALLNAKNRDPALAELTKQLDRPISVPTRVLCGSRDMRKQLLEKQRDLFSGTYQWSIIDGAGHFLHREKPNDVNRELLSWLKPDEG